MATPTEQYVEQFVQALMRQASAVTTVIPSDGIFVQSTDDPPDNDNKDRIVCKAEPMEPFVPAYNAVGVSAWTVMLTLTLYFATKDANKMRDVLAAITEAMKTPYGSLGAPALAALAGGKIVDYDDTNTGDFITEDNGRKRSKTFAFHTNP